MKKRRFETQAINDEILEKLDLRNKYGSIIQNLAVILKDKQFVFLKEVLDFCLKFEKDNKITHGPDEDIYK
jgi:hypothetical protein